MNIYIYILNIYIHHHIFAIFPDHIPSISPLLLVKLALHCEELQHPHPEKPQKNGPWALSVDNTNGSYTIHIPYIDNT